MTSKIFVGNLSWNATEDSLKELFAQFGEVVSVRIVTDPYTGRSKGFGFVEMSDESALNQAIEKLDNYSFINRPLRVSRARQEGAGGPRQNRGPRPAGSRGAHAGARHQRSEAQYDDEM